MPLWDWFSGLAETGLTDEELSILPGKRYHYPDGLVIQRGRMFDFFKKDDGLWFYQPVVKVWYYRGKYIEQN